MTPPDNDAVRVFTHPHATHRIDLAQGGVAYALVRSSRQSISLEIGEHGLVVRAPWRADVPYIETVLRSKAAWICTKLLELEKRQQQKPLIVWQHGACIPYLGGVLEVHLLPQAPHNGELLRVGQQRWALHLPVSRQASVTRVRAAVHAWWLRQAYALCEQRLQHFAPALGVQWRSLRLSNARTRWGSAKLDGSIMLNWRLLHFDLPVIDYVVVHELAHLHEMNHSAKFWAIVEKFCPDYAQLRLKLSACALPDWSL